MLYYTKYHIFQQQLADGALEVEYCEASLYSMKEIKEINRELKRDYKRFQNRILELERNNEEYLVDDIVEFKKKKNHRSYLLMQYIETQISLKKMREKSLLATIREIYPKKLTVKFVDGICSPKVLRKLKAAWL